jgi:hypothetical protein
MILAGVGLMLFGWRLWKVCLLLAYGAIGASLGAALTPEGQSPFSLASLGALLLGTAAFWWSSASIVFLGGLTGCGVLFTAFSSLGLHGPPLWFLAGLSLVACTALSMINRRYVIIVVTSFLGAVVLMSGVTAFIMAMPVLYGTFRGMASYSGIVVPFLVIVPTVISFFYQVSEVHRVQESL